MIKEEVALSKYARIGGVLYLMIILLGAFGQIVIRGSVVTTDAASTYQNLITSDTLWRIGVMGDLIMHALDIPLMIILFMLLKSVSKNLALLGVRYLAGFFEQVKSRDFLTLTIQNSHEEDQIHRSPDHWDLERTGIRPESV